MDVVLRQYEQTRQLVLSLKAKPMSMAEITSANRAAALMTEAAQFLKAGDAVNGLANVRQAAAIARAVQANQDRRGMSASPRKKP